MMKPAAARIYRPTRRNLAYLARRLLAGELVAVPSETVYGLAANAFDPRACQRIFKAKGRPSTDPLIVHLHSMAQLPDVCEPSAEAIQLARCFWPGPLTLVLPKKDSVPAIVTAGLPSVAVRMPSHPVFRRLLRLADVPLAAPSANPFGYISPTTAEHVRRGLGNRIRHILDGGAATLGLESTIVDLRKPTRPVVLRPGFVTVPEIEKVLGRRVILQRRVASKNKALLSPGLLARHYSPRTPVQLHPRLGEAGLIPPSEAVLFVTKPAGKTAANVFWLDRRGDLRGAARRLFATLQRLDARGFRLIHVELAEGDGLAEAINDRLRRAAAR